MIKSDLSPLERIDPHVLGKICSFAGTSLTRISKSLESQREALLLIVIQNMQLFPIYSTIDPTKFSLKSLNIYLKGLIPKEEHQKVSEFAILNIERYLVLGRILKNYEDRKLIQLAKILALQIPNIPKGDAESIRNFLKSPANSEQLNKITTLDLSTNNFRGNTNPNFASIPNEIQYFPNLSVLNLQGNKISDLSPLAGLVNLKTLKLHNNQISDLSPLAGLKNLTELNLSYNQISDLTPLAELVNLKTLTLNNNQISDLTPLAGLVNLEKLELNNNQISDLTPLAGLVNLKQLSLLKNKISKLEPLAAFVNLETLELNNNKISDLTPLAALVSLISLLLTQNEISDLKPLAALVSLTSLSLAQNKISDLKPLDQLVNLENLYLARNEISDLKPLRNLKKLSRLLLKRNLITDLTPILDLNLWSLRIRHNYLSPISEEFKKTLYENIRHLDPECLAYQDDSSSVPKTSTECGGGGSKGL